MKDKLKRAELEDISKRIYETWKAGETCMEVPIFGKDYAIKILEKPKDDSEESEIDEVHLGNKGWDEHGMFEVTSRGKSIKATLFEEFNIGD